MVKYIERNGNCYMIVKPCQKLFNSKTIHDVVTRGDLFAVEMNTGELTVLKREPQAVVIKAPTAPVRTAVKRRKFVFRRPGMRQGRLLSNVIATAARQLAYDVDRGHGFVEIVEDGKVIRAISSSDKTWNAFLGAVQLAYEGK